MRTLIVPNRRVLVFCKVPEAGVVKTRLCPPLSSREAGELAQAFLRDTLDALNHPGKWTLTAAFTPAGGETKLCGLIPPGVKCWPQPDGDLGSRLSAAFATFAHQLPVVIVGSDCPDLPPSRVEQAFQVLERGCDVVLGPTPDGGYYLIGARRVHPELFTAIPWSTDQVRQVTENRAQQAGISLTLLEPWEDVDRFEDLARLKSRLQDCHPGIAPHTRSHLESKLELFSHQPDHCFDAP